MATSVKLDDMLKSRIQHLANILLILAFKHQKKAGY